MVKRHETKWAVRTQLKGSHVVYFAGREDAMAFAYEHGYAVYPPIYG